MTKLEERRKKYGIPDPPYLPQGKNALVYRLPSETRTAGGLYIPETAEDPEPRGVLVWAGLGALDHLRDHLCEIGDVVYFGRFAGWEKEVKRDPENKGKQILQLKGEDILGSEDGWKRYVDGYEIAFDEESGEHYYEKRKQQKRSA